MLITRCLSIKNIKNSVDSAGKENCFSSHACQIAFMCPSHLNVGNRDDSYLRGDTAHQCQPNVSGTCCVFTRLGFIIYPVKSVLKPVQCLGFLGFVLNSINMTVCLPTIVLRIKGRCSKRLSNASISIQELAEVIGLLVSSFQGIIHGPLFYRNLETVKTMALRQNKGNYQALVSLSQESLADLQWWCYNIDKAAYPIRMPNSKIDITLYTYASKKGGAPSWVLRKQEVDGLRQNQIIISTA